MYDKSKILEYVFINMNFQRISCIKLHCLYVVFCNKADQFWKYRLLAKNILCSHQKLYPIFFYTYFFPLAFLLPYMINYENSRMNTVHIDITGNIQNICNVCTKLSTTFSWKKLSYSVMQSDRNSWKIDTFRDAITSELLISS